MAEPQANQWAEFEKEKKLKNELKHKEKLVQSYILSFVAVYKTINNLLCIFYQDLYKTMSKQV